MVVVNVVCINLFKSSLWIIVPTPTLVGRRNYILNWVFFVQSILADRYIHRRELWVVSLKSPASVEYGIKKIFQFSFFTGSYWGLKFCEHLTVLFTFSVVFAKIWHNFANIVQNKLKFLTAEYLLPLEIEECCWIAGLKVFLAKNYKKNFWI